MRNFNPVTWRGGRTYGRFCENQNFLDAYFIFLPMVLRARELRHDSCVPSIYYIFGLPHVHFVLSELIGENVKSVGQGNFTLESWKSQGISETSGCGNHEDTKFRNKHTLSTLGFAMYRPGFEKSLEFLKKKSWNLPRNFSDLEKVWKMEIKSGKVVKKSIFFSKLQQLAVFFFRFGSISPVRLHRIMKEALFLRLYWSQKEINILEKSPEKVLNFGSKMCSNPKCIC